MLIKKDETVKGIFPLMYLDEKRKGFLPFRRIRFLGSTHTDFSVVLADNDDMEIVVEAAMHWLCSGKLRWELLILDDLVEGNPVVDALIKWLGYKSLEHYIHEGKYYYIDLVRPWEEIRSATSKKAVRRSINLARNRISKAGQWEIVVNPELEVDQLISFAAPMHIERQLDLDRGSSYSEQKHLEYLKNIIEINRKNDWFKSYWLRFEDAYIAYMFGFEQNGVFYAWNMAFHPNYSQFFPSKLLMLELIKDCHKKKLKEFSFMRGESDYKTKWTKDFRTNYRFDIRNTAGTYSKFVLSLEKLIK